MFCRFCGRDITGKPQFCPWCGQAIGTNSNESESERNIHSDSMNKKKNWRNYMTVENIERYAPIASFAPVVMALISLIYVAVHLIGGL